MKILLIISFLIPIIYLGYLMSKLDKFLTNYHSPETSNDNSKIAVVLGDTELSQIIIKQLEGRGINVLHMIEPFQLRNERNLYYLFALSGNDADNIAFCKIGSKLYSIENMISVCNDLRDENMFMKENIKYLPAENASPEKLLQMALLMQEVKP